ncbi:MAG: DUF1566 domain-containing protein, partial [Campylobacterales bacterium]|nr:DUF1566 domain-containing protein [Campylobacterales bacterium]
GSTTTWQGAIDRCEALTLDGHTDWRLPNKNELLSIVDLSKVNPAIKSGFVNTASVSYWSATTSAEESSNAWLVYFYSGRTAYYGNRNDDYYSVRCVRSGQ